MPLTSRNARTFKRAQSAWDDRAEPDEPESCTSLQRIGDALVLVDFCTDGCGGVVINGAWIEADFVESGEFAQYRVDRWARDIRAELAREAEL
jgi:hypothetical protein